MFTEINVDGLVGPTHHFGGLGVGNVASIEHQHVISHPRQAALEGLSKASLVAGLGVPQFIFLPPIRPRLRLLSDLGFRGSLQDQLEAALVEAPRAFSAVFSGAFMWMANAATVTPASDAADGRLHCTPANLISSWHRSNEAHEREQQLKSLFGELGSSVEWHRPLPALVPLRDEGAANHMRLSDQSGRIGLNVFVYGEDDETTISSSQSNHFFARQSRAASLAIAKLHQLSSDCTFFLRQHPRAIDAGVFHNDVIATSCDSMFLYHEHAFIDSESEIQRLKSYFHKLCGRPLLSIQVSDEELPLSDAVRSYFFNCQIVRCVAPEGSNRSAFVRYQIVCPHHCETIPAAMRLIERLIADPQIPIERVHFVRLSESMAGGGGPACLRLRMMVDSEHVLLLNNKFRLTGALAEKLAEVIEQWYPESLSISDLCSVDFVDYLTRVDDALQRVVA